MKASNDIVGQALSAIAWVAVTWLAMAGLIQAAQWAPDSTMMQSGRVIAMLVSGVVAVMAGIAATGNLMALLGLRAPKDAAPRP